MEDSRASEASVMLGWLTAADLEEEHQNGGSTTSLNGLVTLLLKLSQQRTTVSDETWLDSTALRGHELMDGWNKDFHTLQTDKRINVFKIKTS